MLRSVVFLSGWKDVLFTFPGQPSHVHSRMSTAAPWTPTTWRERCKHKVKFSETDRHVRFPNTSTGFLGLRKLSLLSFSNIRWRAGKGCTRALPLSIQERMGLKRLGVARGSTSHETTTQIPPLSADILSAHPGQALCSHPKFMPKEAHVIFDLHAVKQEQTKYTEKH